MIALTLAALALRAWDFGNPVIHIDEQFYLLVGRRMWDGAVPFVDIWDRKPVGLFLIYAMAAAFPGDGILAYQLMATAAAIATAAVVRVAALRIGARENGALLAALAYLLWLPMLGGRGGQAPVFYNLLIALGVLWTLALPARAARNDREAILRSGLIACLLAGIAIQLKYTAAVEGAFIGLAHLWWLRRAGAGWRGTTAAAVAWALAGLTPTAIACGAYAAMGPAAAKAFWFANFSSIFLRPPYPPDELAMRLLGIAAQLSPLIACTLLGWRLRRRPTPAPLGLAYAWLIAALFGFAAIGTFFDHYALPLVAPLALLSATTFGRRPRAAVGALGLGLLLFLAERAFVPDDGPGARETARLVRLNARGECPYVFIGDTITYHLSGSCLPTAYAFPNLLAYSTEQGATGIDEAAEVRRILAVRPPVIVSSTRTLTIWNPASLAAVKAAMRRDYRRVWTTPRNGWRTVLYLRNDLSFRR
ncbi:hypothetical protein COC42_02155 [Sphingomonas spermidinifaciens]|uniref:Glycosyltransferase RgtA/B/C/D-like domain-containing protein n=1 Tax=Sphingomonas spermidinifaciens TaxID=1141889 RepID=A0A2A4B609_9SPHN|nr:hypothetical protein COC42_02155 [Sphingomonas spermidinifaciens]